MSPSPEPTCPVQEVKSLSGKLKGKGRETPEAISRSGSPLVENGAEKGTTGRPSWRNLSPQEAEQYASPSLTLLPTPTNLIPSPPSSSLTSTATPNPVSTTTALPVAHALGNPHGHPKSAPVPMHSLVESSEMDVDVGVVGQGAISARRESSGSGQNEPESRTGHGPEHAISLFPSPEAGRGQDEAIPSSASITFHTSISTPTPNNSTDSSTPTPTQPLFSWDTAFPPTASGPSSTSTDIEIASATGSTNQTSNTAVGSGTGSELATGTNDGSRTLCIRHQMMADQGVNGKLQKSLDALPTSERAAITGLWSTFSSSPHPKRKIILEGILTMCCFSQLSHLSESLGQIIRVDPFSLFPKEVCLRTLGYLDAISLGQAAQVSRSWRGLADDDALWRRMCGQHIERKCTKCGWGLPLMERNRLRWEEESEGRRAGVGGRVWKDDGHIHDHDHERHLGGAGSSMSGGAQGQDRRSGSPWMDRSDMAVATNNLATAFSSDVLAKPSLPPGPTFEAPSTPRRTAQKRLASDVLESNTKRRREQQPPSLFAGPGVADKRVGTETSSESEADGTSKDSDEAGRVVTRDQAPGQGLPAVPASIVSGGERAPVRKKKPWKHVYCERLLVERNWRKGRCNITTLKGHTNGVMCLQFHQDLAYPAHPVLITGSYDRTARVWDMETGKVLRVLTGHTRAIRALQFDQVMLVTGSMDRTLRVWNWQTGHCLRVLEGHTDGIICLHYDKEVLASGSADSTIRVWSVSNGDSFILRGHTEWVNSVLLWDGKMGAAGSASANIGGPTTAAPDPVKYLFSSSDDHSIKLWDLKSKTCLRTMFGHTGQVQSLRIVIVDKETEDESDRSNLESRQQAAATPLLEDNSTAHCSTPFQTYFSNANIGVTNSIAPGNTLQANIQARALAETNLDGAFDPVAHARQRRSISSRALVHGQSSILAEPATLFEHSEEKEALLISGGLDNLVKVWDIATGTEKSTLFGHIEGVWAVDVDPLRLASASHDRTIKIWDRETGKCAQTLVGHRGAVTSLQLSDDVLVSGSDDGEVRIWSFAPPKS